MSTGRSMTCSRPARAAARKHPLPGRALRLQNAPMNALVIAGAVVIGLTLGLTGAGGSIVTLPVLVYLGGIAPGDAVPLSLFVVGAAALTGALHRWRRGEICLPSSAVFALSGMAGAALGANFTPLVGPLVLMVIFAFLMLVVAVFMMLPRKNPAPASNPSEQPPPSLLSRALAGGTVGVLTGFIGVGGGFLLVPALLKFGRLDLRQALGTSLAIIFFNCLAGFLSHLGTTEIDWTIALLFSSLASLGVLGGTRLAGLIPPHRLRQGFALMVMLTGLYVLWSSLR